MKKEELLVSKLHEINTILLGDRHKDENLGILTGSSGIALFHFYYSRFTQKEANADYGTHLIAEVIEKINAGYDIASFCTGIAGAAWAIELLREEDFIDLDTDALLSILDDYLIKYLDIDTQENFYDFLHGVLGIGYYFLKRYERTQTAVLKERYKKTLIDIIDLLNTTAVKEKGTAKWESNLIRSEGLRGYNLGLSHGISSIVNFLSRLIKYDDFRHRATPLLTEATNFILSCQHKTPVNSAFFPDWIVGTQNIDHGSRLAWCYGDLGIGISLWHAAKALENQDVEGIAIATLLQASKRRNLAEARVMDAGLCHGSYGIMHVYDHMHKKTGISAFKETADYWMKQGLEMAIHEEGYAGYLQWRGDGKSQWRKETSVLEGIAGIGLSIISYISPSPTKWNQCLMIG